MREALLSLCLLAVTLGAQAPVAPVPQDGAPAAVAYMCPMHPDVMTATPGQCPRCGMDLVPAPASSFVCPMHPDVMSAEPGKCPRCSMDLVPGSPVTLPDFRLHVETTPRVLKAGEPITFRFTAHHPLTDEQARVFVPVHEKLFHLFVISRDMEAFAHVHPEAQPDGSFTITHTLPAPGHYVLFADLLPMGGGAQITSLPLVTAGVDTDIVAARATLTPDAVLAKEADGVRIEVLNERATILGGEEVDLVFRFSDAATDAPITDLQKYLGAFGHLVILSEDMTEYVHAHPRDELQPDPLAPQNGGPEVLFDALLPKPGRYRAWLQFQRKDRLSTVSFTFDAPRLGEAQR